MLKALLLIFVAATPHLLFAQEDGPQVQPPQLKPVFNDNFSKDTRGDFEIEGEVTWESGASAFMGCRKGATPDGRTRQPVLAFG